jgi:hypothetical protein
MKKGTFVFVLTLILFATGTTTIAFTLAKDAARMPSSSRAPAPTIPWYCVRIEPPSGNAQINVPPPGIRGKYAGPTISIDANPGKIVRVPAIAIPVAPKPVKAKPDFPKQTQPTPPTSNPGYNTQTPGYSSGNTGGTSGSDNTGSSITKNNGGTPSAPGYYGNGSSGNPAGTIGTIYVELPNGSKGAVPFEDGAFSKYVSTCPPGYASNIAPICYEILSKKLSGKLTQTDISSPAYSLCVEIIKSSAWNSKATPELCATYKKYAEQCSSTKGVLCMLEQFVKDTGIPSKDVLKMLGDLNQNCWMI